MPALLNLGYWLLLTILFPWLVLRSVMTGRYRQGLSAKLFGLGSSPLSSSRPVIWFHGVSVGEIHLLTTVVKQFRLRHPKYDCVISVTTDTGRAEARKVFPDLPVIPFPLDFSFAVRRTLKALKPDLIVLAESELWPNFLRIARQSSIPVVVINGRMSPRSFARHQKLGWLTKPLLLEPVTRFLMQTENYAENLRNLGIAAEKVAVTGSVKYDGAPSDRRLPKTLELREKLGIAPTDLVWVAGSTHAPEEAMLLEVFRRVRVHYPELRLLLVPRSPDRFDEVARLAQRQSFSLLRRSQLPDSLPANPPAVILLDSMGELSAVWGLADIGYVGGSLGCRRGGQSMIEPAGLGVPVLFGPDVWNFRDAANRLKEAGAAVVIHSPKTLEKEVLALLNDPVQRERMGSAAKKMVQQQQGATERTLDELDNVLGISLASLVRKSA